MCTENDFSGAKVGDRVWDYLYGWGEIIDVNPSNDYPIRAEFKGHTASYTLSGFFSRDYMNPSLFHDEVKITPPPRPKRKVKKPISVWMNIYPDGDRRTPNENVDSSFTVWRSYEKAAMVAEYSHIACVELKGEYEVEE